MVRRASILMAFFLACASARADDALFRRVRTLLDEGRAADAVAALDAGRDAVDAGEMDFWWALKGIAHGALRQDDKALEAFGRSVELNPGGGFGVRYALLLHEYGRWDEATKQLEGPVADGWERIAEGLRAVIEGPYRRKYPHAWKKAEYRSKAGNFHVVSDAGLDFDGLQQVEDQLAKLDPGKRAHAELIEKLLKPTQELVNVANLLELARKEYMKLTGLTEAEWPKGKVFKVVLLRGRQEFLEFAEQVDTWRGKENTLGFYSPTLKYLTL